MNKYKAELVNRLLGMNDLLSSKNETIELVIIGGAVFVLKWLVPRATYDFDYINEVERPVINFLIDKGFDVNNRAVMFDEQFGPDVMNDLVVLFKKSNLIVKSTSNERLMIARMFSGKRYEDYIYSMKSDEISKVKFEMVFQEVYPFAIVNYKGEFGDNKYLVKELYNEKDGTMRTQSLRTYVNSKFKEYYNKPLRLNALLEDSKNDSRLAELAQAHFLVNNQQEKANKFVVFTKELYFVDTFEFSDQKYAYQFNNRKRARRENDYHAREVLKDLFDNKGYSKYRVAKELNTNQSNLTEFYSKFKSNKLNADKVFEVYGF